MNSYLKVVGEYFQRMRVVSKILVMNENMLVLVDIQSVSVKLLTCAFGIKNKFFHGSTNTSI